MRSLIAVLKLFVFLIYCGIVIPVQTLTLLLYKEKGQIPPHIFLKFVCPLFGIKYKIKGTPCLKGQTLFVGNHLSYLDIPLVGAALPISFIAKKEVAGWPLFGLLAKLQRTAFVERSRQGTIEGQDTVENRLKLLKHLVLFPEGTSSTGETILPFKSSFFAPVLTKDITVQPFTISLLRTDQTTPLNRDLYAWYGDMELAPHLWTFAKSRGVEICLTFGPPRSAKTYTDRKKLAQDCYKECVKGLISVEKSA